MSTLIQEALLEQVQRSLIPLVARIDRMASDWLAKQLAELGVSMPEFRVIGALLGETTGIPQNALAKRLGVEQATLSVTLSKLEAKGVVTRYPDAEDTRIRRVAVSRQGARFGEIKVLLEFLETSAISGLQDAEIQMARQVLMKMEKNLSHLLDRGPAN